MISAPEYTTAPKAAVLYAGASTTYTVVPAHTFSRIDVAVTQDHHDANHHMNSYLSSLWAQDWDNPEDSVYDEW